MLFPLINADIQQNLGSLNEFLAISYKLNFDMPSAFAYSKALSKLGEIIEIWQKYNDLSDTRLKEKYYTVKNINSEILILEQYLYDIKPEENIKMFNIRGQDITFDQHIGNMRGITTNLAAFFIELSESLGYKITSSTGETITDIVPKKKTENKYIYIGISIIIIIGLLFYFKQRK